MPKRVSVRSSIVCAAPTSACRIFARGFDVDNHAVIGVDQIVIGVDEKGVSPVRACPLRRRIGKRDELRRHGRGGAASLVERLLTVLFERPELASLAPSSFPRLARV